MSSLLCPTRPHRHAHSHDSGYSTACSAPSESERKIQAKNPTDEPNVAESADSEILTSDEFRRYADENESWVSMHYENGAEDFEHSGWSVGTALCPDRAIKYPGEEIAARGVFTATELVPGGRQPRKGVIKIYMQTNGDPGCVVPDAIVQEIEALLRLQEAAQSTVVRAPQLVDYKMRQQEDWLLVPGGWIVFIVMTTCQGRHLCPEQFYRMPTSQRDKIRECFETTMRAVYAAGVQPLTMGMQNLLWHEEKEECFVIDFESSLVSDGSVEEWFSARNELDYFQLTGWRWIDNELSRSSEGDNFPPGDVTAIQGEPVAFWSHREYEEPIAA